VTSDAAGSAMSEPAVVRVVLVRHGQTEWSASGRHTGLTDVPLTAHGKAQAVALGPAIADLLGGPPSDVRTSPLARAALTAELAGLTATVDDDLREVDYGDYEGLTTPQIRETVPGWTVWTHLLPGGETLAQAAERADRALARLRGEAVLVAHGHFLRILTARWLGLPPDAGRLFKLDTATLSVLGTERETRVIERWNQPALKEHR
jgi:broad specificity phosphatase PhoE